MTDEWTTPAAPVARTGQEPFDGVDATVADFWSFAMSDLRTNNVRGYLAEFLVARAVGATSTRIEWDAFDVLTPDGVKIEVKSAGYMQAWAQRRPSRISFSGLNGRAWNYETSEWMATDYNADVYVFAVETAMTHEDYNPLDVQQWRFYVCSRSVIAAKNCKSLQLSSLEAIATGPISFADLEPAVRSAAAANDSTPLPRPISDTVETVTDTNP